MSHLLDSVVSAVHAHRSLPQLPPELDAIVERKKGASRVIS